MQALPKLRESQVLQRTILFLLCFLALRGVSAAFAEGPQVLDVCIGAPRSTTEQSRGVPLDGLCPKNFAAYGGTVGRAARGTEAAAIGVIPFCCPLPAADVLLDTHVYVESECPKGFVVTGVDPVFAHPGKYMWNNYSLFTTNRSSSDVVRLRCTKINMEKYSLAEERQGIFWGNSAKEWREPLRISWSEIPPALRYGIGRVSEYQFFDSGCIGNPFGALLTAKRSRYCRDMGFRPLFYAAKTMNADIPLPVQMYPECLYVKDYLTESPQCVR